MVMTFAGAFLMAHYPSAAKDTTTSSGNLNARLIRSARTAVRTCSSMRQTRIRLRFNELLIETTRRLVITVGDSMMMNFARVAILFCACFTLLVYSCAKNERAHMVTQDQALEIAKAEFARHGKAVSDYDISVDRDEASRTFWMICFEK